MTFVDIRNLSFAYDRKRPAIIDHFSLTMDKGEIAGILGPSGGGKSTLLRLIAGLEIPADGSITIDGQTVVDGHTFVPPETRGVGMVFQDYALFPHLTIAQNIAFGLHLFTKAERLQRVRDMLELVHLSGYEQRYPHELSGGQQQRVALARALAPKPIMLLMDEPFSNLDTELRKTIRTELGTILRKEKMTCIFVTHDRDDVDAICDRAVLM